MTFRARTATPRGRVRDCRNLSEASESGKRRCYRVNVSRDFTTECEAVAVPLTTELINEKPSFSEDEDHRNHQVILLFRIERVKLEKPFTSSLG